jgi:hypothetical protein
MTACLNCVKNVPSRVQAFCENTRNAAATKYNSFVQYAAGRTWTQLHVADLKLSNNECTFKRTAINVMKVALGIIPVTLAALWTATVNGIANLKNYLVNWKSSPKPAAPPAAAAPGDAAAPGAPASASSAARVAADQLDSKKK